MIKHTSTYCIISNSLEELQNLPRIKGRMFLNSFYTDGYTCRISFARNVPEKLEEDRVKLEIDDFNQDDVSSCFRPCFLDPGRKSAYVAYYGNEQVRSLSTNEYYYSSGSVNRARKEDNLKIEQGIKDLETRIPSSKTSSVALYMNHFLYMLAHMDRFFDFYNFRTASINWNNYHGRQCALEEACNILINGGKKYNLERRKKTRSNRRKRKKMVNRQNPRTPNTSIEIKYDNYTIVTLNY